MTIYAAHLMTDDYSYLMTGESIAEVISRLTNDLSKHREHWCMINEFHGICDNEPCHILDGHIRNAIAISKHNLFKEDE